MSILFKQIKRYKASIILNFRPERWEKRTGSLSHLLKYDIWLKKGFICFIAEFIKLSWLNLVD